MTEVGRGKLLIYWLTGKGEKWGERESFQTHTLKRTSLMKPIACLPVQIMP